MEGPPALRVVRVTLKGHKIWSFQGGQICYLDGQAFAEPGLRSDGVTPRTDLLFPSGAGVRASDFESWFYLPAQIVPPPPNLVGFTVNPNVVQAGQPVSLTVTLDRSAPAGGVTIAVAKTMLSGADPVPSLASVTIPEGEAGVTITLETRPNAAASLSLKATLRQVELTATLTVRVVAITIAPPTTSLFVNGSVQLTASVTGAAQTGVTFAITEGVQGGALAQTGANTATYTAPNQPGTFHVVATSVADRTKSATATITVIRKVKDGKEGKELVKEQLETPKAIRDNVVVKSRETGTPKIREVVVPRGLGGEGSAEEPGEEGGGAEGRGATRGSGSGAEASGGKAFIKPEERPPVGEPRRGPRMPAGRKSKRKPKA